MILNDNISQLMLSFGQGDLGKVGPMNSLDRDPLILAYDVGRLLRTRLDQRARTYGMTRAQWILLARLERQPGISQNEMAAICEVEPISVGRLVDRLEAQGLVQRRPDPADRRIRRLHLLPAAAPILEEIGRQRDWTRKRVTEGLDEKTLNILADTLLRLKENLTADFADETPVAVAGE
jgi:MarR family transcriptional regulator, transcriptional regulator for hemolysin